MNQTDAALSSFKAALNRLESVINAKIDQVERLNAAARAARVYEAESAELRSRMDSQLLRQEELEAAARAASDELNGAISDFRNLLDG